MPDENQQTQDPQAQPVPTATAPQTDPTSALLGIMKGEIGTERIIKFVRNGPKLDNFSMHILLKTLKEELNYDYKILLKIYLALDSAVEKEIITNEFLDTLKANPELINKLLDEETGV